MAILSTLAELAEYFKGWHTKYYESLHKGLPPADHANAKATKTKYGHVKLTDQLSPDNCYDGSDSTKDSYALCPKAGYDLEDRINNAINTERQRITALEQQVYNSDTVKVKIGKIFPTSDETLNTLTLQESLDMHMGYEFTNNPIGTWGNTKVHISATLKPTQPERIAIKLMDSYQNPLSNDDGNVKKTTIWINVNGVWYPRRTNDLGFVFLRMQLHDPNRIYKYSPQGDSPNVDAYNESIRNAILQFGDKWMLMEVFANVLGKYGNVDNVYSSVSKKFLLNYGHNLWDYAMTDNNTKATYLPEAIGVNAYEVYRNGTPRFSGKLLKDYAIKDSNNSLIGYNIKVIDPQQGEGQYYRFPRDSYPYGSVLANDINDYPSTLDNGGI